MGKRLNTGSRQGYGEGSDGRCLGKMERTAWLVKA